MATCILSCLGTWESGSSLVPFPVVHIAHAAHDCPETKPQVWDDTWLYPVRFSDSCAAQPVPKENVSAVIGRSPQLEE